ncbi:MAG: hypothetical protein ACLFR1_13260 [Spirochaetia bacterium]
MNRDDFAFTVGYQGDTAVVDKSAKAKHKPAKADKLMEAGLFRAAFCAALYDQDELTMEEIRKVYSEKTGADLPNLNAVKRLFGAFEVPDAITKVMYIK